MIGSALVVFATREEAESALDAPTRVTHRHNDAQWFFTIAIKRSEPAARREAHPRAAQRGSHGPASTQPRALQQDQMEADDRPLPRPPAPAPRPTPRGAWADAAARGNDGATTQPSVPKAPSAQPQTHIDEEKLYARIVARLGPARPGTATATTGAPPTVDEEALFQRLATRLERHFAKAEEDALLGRVRKALDTYAREAGTILKRTAESLRSEVSKGLHESLHATAASILEERGIEAKLERIMEDKRRLIESALNAAVTKQGAELTTRIKQSEKTIRTLQRANGPAPPAAESPAPPAAKPLFGKRPKTSAANSGTPAAATAAAGSSPTAATSTDAPTGADDPPRARKTRPQGTGTEPEARQVDGPRPAADGTHPVEAGSIATTVAMETTPGGQAPSGQRQ
jgi:hypothetical protein